MGMIKSLTNTLKYDAKYTAGSYADALMSIPIWGAEKIASGLEKVMGEKTPKFLTRQHIYEKSPVFKGRERLRENLDTRPGALFLQSNLVGAIPFVLAGMPAAEAAQAGLESYFPNMPEIAQYAVNSLTTLMSQMVVGYGFFMVNEVRTNRDKYVNEDNKLSARKIAKGTYNTVKAFLLFDLTYAALKTSMQSLMLWKGKDPWKASILGDKFAIPAWCTLCIPLGLHKRVIENKQTEVWDKENEQRKTA